jgi:phage tail sheath protein FI
MAFQVSPGVNVSEIDLTTVVPAVSTSVGAIAGVFKWGPVGTRTLISSETELAAQFGKPTNHNPETFFTAANFLAYGNALYVVRAANTTNFANGVISAVANTGSVTNAQVFTIKSEDTYDNITFSNDTDVLYVARCPGELGNSLKISVCDSVNAYSKSINITGGDANLTSGLITATVGSNTVVISASNTSSGTLAEANTRVAAVLTELQINDVLEVGNSSIGKQYLKITGLPASMGTNGLFTNATSRFFTANVDSVFQLSTEYTSNTFSKYWEYFNTVDSAPGISDYQSSQGNTTAVDELHVVVADEDGKFSGVPGTVLEVYKGLSRATDAKTSDGTTNFYKTVINENSKYVWFGNHRSTAPSNTALNIASVNTTPLYISFQLGQDGDSESDVSVGTVLAGYNLFASAEDVDISLVMTGKSRGGTNGEQIANFLVDNIAETRKDCIVLASPDKPDVVNNTAEDESDDTVTFRNSCRSSSYLVIDSGYKYQYDKYNDIFRWVPLNGDIAGLCVRTDTTRDPWFSPAGFNRGQIKNLVKLAYNPDKADRDLLYKNGINPVATFPGQGTILFGDKTALSKPSAFDRISVRRLFIVLEKAIATAAKFSLFELNDEFTRAQFVSLVEPFLRDVQGRRGIYDYRVVCNETNNTGDVIDRNEFVGDIYVKPAKSINFIQLNFVAVRSGVSFDEIVGKF